MQVSPKIITGALHTQNKGASDWEWQGLLAYGCQQYIVVIDPKTSQTIQTLRKHRGIVTAVKWRRENYHHDVANPYILCLASGDTNGLVVVWNVVRGEIKFEFKDGNKPVNDMNWFYEPGKQDLLLVLYGNSTVVLWDCVTATQLWKKAFTDQLMSFTLNPFNPCHAAFLGEDCAIVVTDLNINKPPSKGGRKIYTLLQTDQDSGNPSSPITPTSPTSTNLTMRKNPSSWNKLLSFTSNSIQTILTGENKLKESRQRKSSSDLDFDAINSCIQLTYHPGIKHHILLVYQNQVLILDLEVNIVVGSIRLIKIASPFVKVLPCQNMDVLFCLHENGSVSVRLRRMDASFCPQNHIGESVSELIYDLVYDNLCQSDAVRVTNSSRLLGFALHPVTEKTVSIIMGDGRVLLWDVVDGPGKKRIRSYQSNNMESLPYTISDLISQSNYNKDLKAKPNLRLLLTGIIYGLVSPITVIKACPSVKNNPQRSSQGHFVPVVAVGSQMGLIQIIDLDSGQIVKEFDVFFNGNVGGIEWINHHELITWSSPTVYNAGPGQVKNIIFQLSINSGQIIPIRVKKDAESTIVSLRVSPLRQYMLIAFEKQPLEIWSLTTRTLLREMPHHFPQPRQLEWSPTSSWRTVKNTMNLKNIQSGATSETKVNLSTVQMCDTQLPDVGIKKVSKEQVIFADKIGGLCRLTLEETSVTDITMFQPDASGLSVLVHVAWKGNYLLLGDVSGYIRVFSLKTKVTTRSIYDKQVQGLRKIVFNPSNSDMTFLVLSDASVETWRINTDKLEVISSLKCPQDIENVIDVDWANSKHPLLLTKGGWIHVYDKALKSSRSHLQGRQLEDPIFCPHMLPLRCSLLLKHSLQHQQTITFSNSNDKEMESIIKQQSQLIDRNIVQQLNLTCISSPERFLIVARLFGDEFEIHIWSLVLHFLNHYVDEEVLIDLDNVKQQKELFNCSRSSCLQTLYDVLLEKRCFKRQQLFRVNLHDRRRSTYEDSQKCVENYVLLNEVDAAVRILLETDFEKEDFKTDYLRACLFACDRSTANAQSILKLVATHLIIGSKLSEGIELMCLMGKVQDACRYLQTYGEWDKAAWLAKAMLPKDECTDVFNKWIEHLLKTNKENKAVIIMLSQRQFIKAVEVLSKSGYIDTAYNLMFACRDNSTLQHSAEIENLLSEAKNKYNRYLERLGCGNIKDKMEN